MKHFAQLEPSEKVYAILGVVLNPVTKTLAIDFAGVNYETLSTIDKVAVDLVFDRPNVLATQVDGLDRYILDNPGREELSKEVDMNSAEIAVTSNLLDYWDQVKDNSDLLFS